MLSGKLTWNNMISVSKAHTPQIAISSRVDQRVGNLIDFALQNHFRAIEYTIKAEDTPLLKKEIPAIDALAGSALDIRYHAPFKTVELSHKDREYTERSSKYLKECIDVIADHGAHHMVVHIAFGFRFSLESLSYSHALKYLEEVASYGHARGVTVCLENLTYGWTNNPETFLELVRESGARATIDIGHLSASPLIVDGDLPGTDFIRMLAPYIAGAHVYEIEIFDTDAMTPRHIAPKDTTIIQPLLTELLHTDCNWWLIELGDKREVMETNQLLTNFLSGCSMEIT